MLDEKEFLSPFGIRSLSRHHADHPFVYHHDGQEFRVDYAPAESTSGMFGGNSNWRGPIWMPVNILLFRGLMKLYAYYGDDFKVECPTGSGNQMTLFEVAKEIGNRLIAIFSRDADGRRPVYGGPELFQSDPNWRDHILFYEYFHGDNGAGIGASHQTGWTGAVAIDHPDPRVGPARGHPGRPGRRQGLSSRRCRRRAQRGSAQRHGQSCWQRRACGPGSAVVMGRQMRHERC